MLCVSLLLLCECVSMDSFLGLGGVAVFGHGKGGCA